MGESYSNDVDVLIGRIASDSEAWKEESVKAKKEGGHLQAKEGERMKLTMLTPWSWTFSLQICKQINFSCLSHLLSGTCLGLPLQTKNRFKI